MEAAINLQPNNLDGITFGVNNLVSHDADNLIGVKSSLSSSSSTSSTSSAAASSSSSHNSIQGKSHRQIKSIEQIYNNKQTNGAMKVTKSTDHMTENTNELICPLCKKKLEEPKVLNCLHVFCKQCLVLEMQSHISQSDDCNTIICPKCKQETMISDGIDSIQDDCIIQNMLDMVAIEEMTLECTSCNAGEKAEARCSDCAQFLCEACVKAHQLMRCFSGHLVVKFEEIKNIYHKNLEESLNSNQSDNQSKIIDRGVPIHKPVFCKFHTKESLKFFCNTCQVPICSECVVNIHTLPLHQCERLNEAEFKNIEELHMLVDKAKKKIIECNVDITDVLDQYCSDLQTKLELSKSQIENTHQAYVAILEKRKEEVMRELEEKHSSKEVLIMDMHNSIEQSKIKLNDLIRFVQRCLTNGNCSEILLLKNLILNQLGYLTDNLPSVHSLDMNMKFHTDINRFEKAIFDTYGRFMTEKEIKQRLLDHLTIESNDNILPDQQQQRLHQMMHLQKQIEFQQSSQRQQEMILSNMLKAQQFMNINEQNQMNPRRPSSRNSIASPTQSLTDDWIRNIVKSGTQMDDNQSNQQILMNQNQLHTSLSPQSSSSSHNTHTSSSTVNSNPWNSNTQQHQVLHKQLTAANSSSYQLTIAQQQLMLSNLQNTNFMAQKQGIQQPRSNSPIDFNNMGNLNQMQQHLSSRSETPNFSTNQVSQGQMLPDANNVEEFVPYGSNSNSITQNFNRLSKLMAPQSNLNDLTNNINEIANFPEIHSNASQSPSGNQQLLANVGTIGSGMSSMIVQAQQQSSFAGNGNLNPPVRQNGKMSNMQIRTKFGTLGAGKAQFNSPHGFCLGGDEEIIVADTNNHRMLIFDKNGEFKCSFGSPGREEGQLWFPRKVTVMRDSGKFVICDRGSERSRMQIFNKNGAFVKKISIRYIDIVAGLAITSNGDIVAVDSVSPTVFRIAEAGDLKKWFDCSDHMREPSDIAISGNEYFVCDFKGHCVVVFNEEGNFMRRIGGENITNFPNGIDVSDAGDVLIGDSHGNRFHVAVFTREGAMLSEFECPYVKVSRCCGLKITSEGYVVTLAKNNHHVLVLNTLYVS